MEYDASAITALVASLEPRNCLVCLTTRSNAQLASEEPLLTEVVYGTEYSKQPLEPRLIERWTDADGALLREFAQLLSLPARWNSVLSSTRGSFRILDLVLDRVCWRLVCVSGRGHTIERVCALKSHGKCALESRWNE